MTSSAVVASPGANWKTVGTGDFNDDGKSDILLQNTSGAVAIWDMNGTSITDSAVVANPGANWKAVGTGDFNHDGHSDILLQNTNGAVVIWEMNGANGTNVADSAVVANPGANWKVVGTGDFNGDSHSDILLQNTNGNVAIWEMNGTDLMSSAAVANPEPNWHPSAGTAAPRPFAQPERPNRELEHQRNQHHRQRRRERQRRAKLAGGRAHLSYSRPASQQLEPPPRLDNPSSATYLTESCKCYGEYPSERPCAFAHNPRRELEHGRIFLFVFVITH